ncbi:hypothetical protein ABZ804_21980 [Streptomyces sp. NPDC047726]|uniref:hypothetical protein n=1 Tax=Streptomyces sp. NPDC047726 TaxID=3156651 RepID=UPI0033EE409B
MTAKAAKNAPNVNDLALAPDDVAGALAATGTPGAALEQMTRNKDGGWTAIVSLPVGVSPVDIGGSRQRVAVVAFRTSHGHGACCGNVSTACDDPALWGNSGGMRSRGRCSPPR